MTLSFVKKTKSTRTSFVQITFTVVAFLLITFSTFCQSVVDQSHTGTNDWYTCLVDGQVIGQSFTAGKSGNLTGVELDFFINPCLLY
jgi:hypothetical protein